LQINQTIKDTMEPNFTQEHLDKVSLSHEELEYYSKPDEIKRLLLERSYYQLATQKLVEKINTASNHLNSILDTPISITKRTYTNSLGFKQTQLITKTARDFVYEYRIKELANKIFSNSNYKGIDIDNIKYTFLIKDDSSE